MGTRDETTFEAFVAARSDELLRTAVLLTRDRGHAEDLLQTALVKAYRRWSRIDGADPYPYVRRILVTSAASWRRLRSSQELFSTAFRSGPDALAISRRSDGHVLEANEAWLRLMGHEAPGETRSPRGRGRVGPSPCWQVHLTGLPGDKYT